MSHFTVLVVGKDPEGQLAAFHQFECTGFDDEYVKDIDITESRRNDYTTGLCNKYKDDKGTLHEPYNEQFYREPTDEEKAKIGIGGCGCGDGLSYDSRDWKDGKGYRAKIHFKPEGYEEVDIPYSELMSFRDYLEQDGSAFVLHGHDPDLSNKHKYGYVLLDQNGEVVKVIDRTNPNYKWDWYQLGGRWQGFYKLREGKLGVMGKAGIFDNEAQKGFVDQVKKENIDFEGIKNEAERKAREKYSSCAELFGGGFPKMTYLWEDLSKDDSLAFQERRDLYHNQEALKEIEKLRQRYKELTKIQQDFLYDKLEEYQCTEDEFAERARKRSITTFALLKDGIWYERGSMGWWGCVSDEKDENLWLDEYSKLIDDLPDDTLLSVYDCHI
jgi:hypothetical protein